MKEESDSIKALWRKLDLLLEKQAYFDHEIGQLKSDLDQIRF